MMPNAIHSKNASLRDVTIQVAVSGSRFEKKFKNQTLSIGEFVNRLSTPTVTQETLPQYLHMTKAQQDDIKDVGGYVGGVLKGGIRNTRSVANRSIVTLDLDSAGDATEKEVLDKLAGALPNAASVIHSTHKHRPGCVRLRWVGFLSRPVYPDEYQAIGRKIASLSNIEWFDDTTFETARIMYWPSHSREADYVFVDNTNDGSELIDVDTILSSYGPDDAWKDSTVWPTSSRQQTVIQRELKNQQNPLEKSGIVGAFCRVYDIHKAISEFLPDVYRKDGGRYTYLEGSTAKGVVVYGPEGNKKQALWTYSNHATDPTSGQLCNAFDLVRIHLFGHLDVKTKPDTPTHKLPSYQSMIEKAMSIKDVQLEDINRLFQDADKVSGYFDDVTVENIEPGSNGSSAAVDNVEDPDAWKLKLMRMRSGDVQANFYNACLLLQHEANLKNIIWHNEFSDRIEYARKRLWRDEDTSSVRKYLAEQYQINFTEADVQKAVDLVGFESRSYHPVKDYLKRVNGTWDGVERAARLFVDYLGEEDNAYTRETALCWLIAACMRIWEPGYKFDYVPVLSGAQGIGKSTFCSVIAQKWFGELNTFDDQKAVEQMSMCWIMEIPEMTATSRHEIEEQKRFIAATGSKVRLSYRRNSAEYKRHCVFIGTTNLEEYLKDSTGNRRWWPIRCNVQQIDNKKLRKEIDQIWAEVMDKCADPDVVTELGEEAINIALLRQDASRVSDAWVGIIIEWLNGMAHKRRYDADWCDVRDSLPSQESDMELRDRVSVQEIWQDCFGGRRTDLKLIDARRIGSIMDSIPHWKRRGTVRFGERFGIQKGWILQLETAPF